MSERMDITGAPILVEVTPEIIDLGRFAVDEHNKKENTHLEFKKVMSAKVQEVNGTNYYLTLEAAEEGKINFFEATLYVWSAKEQEVEGFNYYLTLEAADDEGGKNNVYEATVFVSLENVKELVEFKLVANV